VQAPDGSLRAQGTGAYETLECGMILRSVGYRGVPLPGVPYNNAGGTIPNVAGRVTEHGSGDVVPGEYAVGWAKRGPSGVIGTNKPDALATVVAMIEDLPILTGATIDGDLIDLLKARDIAYIDYAGWKTLDEYEIAAGAAQGRPRIKEVRVEKMLAIIRAAKG
jgi:ferredoxin--NADP+ reductase